jgi:hypothetical protein
MNILIFGGSLMCHMLFRVGFGISGLLRNLYADLTVKILVVVRFIVK